MTRCRESTPTPNNNAMIILGIDPGYDRLGIAVVERPDGGGRERLLYSDCFSTSPKSKFAERLAMIGEEVKNVILKYRPGALAIEKLYITNNQKTAMNVSEARGVVIYEAARHGLEIYEFSPPEIKVAVTGDGKSDKRQIMKMVSLLIKLPEESSSDDEYDAIAVALTCFAKIKSFPQQKRIAKKSGI